MTALPPLVEGQVLPATFSSHAKETSPPPRYTEATLLGAMETAGKRIDDEALRAAMKDTGLGTPATRASIIETLLRREYIAREKNHLVATPLGESLIAQIPLASLASPELTGTWEARLAAIARRQDTRAAFMADIARYVTQIVDAVRGAPAPPAPPPGSSPPPAWQSRGKGKRPRGRNGAFPRKRASSASTSSSSTGEPRTPRKRRAKASSTPTFTRPPSSAPRSVPPAAPTGSRSSTTASTPNPRNVLAQRAAALPTSSRAAPSTTRAELSVESTAWLSDLILAMAPDKPEG